MRGDSVRDLYAKALALFGLSLLAGAGAIVDYWPVSGAVPRVVTVPNRLPSVARLPLAASVGVAAPALARVPQTAVPHAASVTPDLVSTPATSELFMSMPVEPAMPIGEPVGLTIPTVPVMIPAPANDAPASEVELAQLPLTWARERTNGSVGPSLLTASQQVDDGFFSGALKKTRDSIMKTGAATGASIADAFRGVANAFKKVSPFNDEAFFKSGQ
jgi:hypothetical protein